MFDGIQFLLMVSMVFDQLMKKLPELVNHADNKTGEVYSTTTIFKGLRVQLKQRTNKIVKVNGSIHRYFTGGANDTLFTYTDLINAIHDLSTRLEFDPSQAKLQRIEFGVNIPVDSPEDLIDSAILYSGRAPAKRKQGRRKYYKEWAFNEYFIKLYRKGQHLVRFEIRMLRERKLKEVLLYTLDDLNDYSKFCGCLHYLESLVDNFLFVPDAINLLPEEMRTDWALFRNDQYWVRLNKWTKTRRKDEVKKAIERFNLTNWGLFLREDIRTQGSLMIENRVATISSLGLLSETVAALNRSCDRKEDESSRIIIHVCTHPKMANEGWRADDIISSVSYFPLLPRGPPSLLSVFLLEI